MLFLCCSYVASLCCSYNVASLCSLDLLYAINSAIFLKLSLTDSSDSLRIFYKVATKYHPEHM